MSSTAITAQGITIARFGTTTFETIPNVVSFQGPGGQAAVIDVTNLASTAKEKRVGLRDECQLSLTLHYNPDDLVHQGLDLLSVAQLAGTSVRMIEQHYGHLRKVCTTAAEMTADA